MSERALPELTRSECDVRDIEISRRLKPEERLRVMSFLSEVARLLAAEIVDREFPGLPPLQRAWKIIAHNNEDHIPDIRIHNVQPYAERVGLSAEWAELQRELAIE
jgi:hypothetical protein